MKKWNLKKLLFALVMILVLVVVPLSLYTLLAPKFRVQTFDEEIKVNIGSSFKPNSGSVCYGNFFSCESVQVEEVGEVDTSKTGDYEVKYRYTFEGESMEKEQMVKVLDLEGPTIEVKSEDLTYCPNGKVPDYEILATDNLDGDLTSQVKKEGKDGKIIFSVTDSSGNETRLEKDATEKDDIPPSLILNGDATKYIKKNESYQEEKATSNDFCDGDLSNQIEISGSVDTSKPGEYQIQYKIQDSSGNVMTAIRQVFVYENNNYNAPNGKSIYLTFDDGPGKYTENLLNILKEYNVKATFFVTDQGLTKGYDQMILRAYQEGHTIGLHSNSHSYSIYTNEQTYFDDLYAIQAKVERITGAKSYIIRFPGGSSNTVSESYDGGTKIMSRLTKAVEQRGFRYFDWNIASGDAGETTNTNKIVSNVISSLGNNSTYVVLQHDIKDYSVNAVRSIIEYGLSHGYTFRALTMQSPVVHHHINN